MGWVSFLEDLKKHADELDALCEQIERGEVPYSEPNRRRVRDISRSVRIRVNELENTLRKLGPADQELMDEVFAAKQQIARLLEERTPLEKKLTEAFEQVAAHKESCDDEKRKLRYIVDLYRTKGVGALAEYISKLKH